MRCGLTLIGRERINGPHLLSGLPILPAWPIGAGRFYDSG